MNDLTNRTVVVATLPARVVFGVLMRPNFARLFIMLGLLWPLQNSGKEVVADDRRLWRAGVARAAITPDTDVWLAGYGTKRPPDGKLHDLWLKVLALQDQQGRTCVLITSDFQGVPRSMSDRVFSQLYERVGLKREQVWFTFSHNHCGPRLGDDLIDYYPVEEQQEQLVREYTDRMVMRTVETVEKALAGMTEVEMWSSAGRATFAVNRRDNPEADVARMLAAGEPLRGPVDHTVPVLKIVRRGGDPLAIVFGYACHPTTLNFNTWCGDYPGFAQLVVERQNPGAQAMFVNTCGGDQNPLPRRSVELCERYGQLLAEGVQEALKGERHPIASELQMAFEYVSLPYLKMATRDELQRATSDSNPIRARWATRILRQLDDGTKFEEAYRYPVHAWRFGEDQLLLGLGAEVVVDYALRFKREYGDSTWVCGYTDDMIAYIPSRRVWEEGGYEGGSNLFEYGRPAVRWAGDIEDRIAASVAGLVEQIRRKQ